jgi:siroheme synthase
MVIGTAETISHLAEEADLNSPVVIIIGEVILERTPTELIKDQKLIAS